MLTEVDTLKHDSNTSAYRSDYFMIEDYRASNLRMDINDYVIKNLDSNYLKFDQYTMYFYKESKVVNIDYINRFHKNSRYKAIEDEKPVLHYVWYNGKLHIYDF
jgi:hypothetical protein